MNRNNDNFLPGFYEHLKVLLYIVFFSLSGVLVFAFLSRYLGILFFDVDLLNPKSGAENPDFVAATTLYQGLSLLGIFLAPAILTPLVLKKKANDFVPYKNPVEGRDFFAFIILFIVAFPFLEWIIIMNQKMQLPGFMQGLENWMQEQESSRGELTFMVAKASTIGELLIKLLVIAVVPAICEEFFFRGTLLKFLTNWTKRSHLSIFLGAFIFSAIHLQFYGFLPRFILGLFFGYTVYLTRSIWIAVILHFINNSIAVLVIYFNNFTFEEYQNQGETMEYSNLVTIISLGLAALIFLSLAMYYNKKRDKSTDWTKVFTTRSKQEAEIISGKLEEAGIKSVVMNKSGSTFHFIGPVELYVAPEDQEKAMEIINQEQPNE
jgi:membrane protease YdiL (CAAX protease family)